MTVQHSNNQYSTKTTLERTEHLCVPLQLGEVDESDKAFKSGFRVAEGSRLSYHGMIVQTQMRQGCGRHDQGVDIMTKALEAAQGDARAACMYLRGKGACLGEPFQSTSAGMCFLLTEL